MGEKKKVTIIILNFNGKADTLECLDSIEKLTQNQVQVNTTVIDNASSDDSVAVIRQMYPHVQVIANRKNLGFCEGNNLGTADAFKKGADYVFVLNNDTLVDPSLVESLVVNAEKQGADVVSPKIFFAPGYEFHKGRYRKSERGKVFWYAGGLIDWANVWPSHRGVDEVDRGQYDTPQETQFVTGCATLISKKVYEYIGLYDPKYFAYFEDADFSIRAKKAGFKILYSPQSMLWHKNAASFGGSGSPFQDYFITRNRLLFGLRHASLRTKLALVRQSAGFLLRGPTRRRRAVIDALLRRIPILESLN